LAERLLSPGGFALTLAFTVFFNAIALVFIVNKGFGYTLGISLAAL